MTGPTRVSNRGGLAFGYGAVTLCGPASQPVPLAITLSRYRSHNPGGRVRRFGLFPFRSPLLGESSFLSFPVGTEMFQFPTFAPRGYGFTARSFGDPGINACLTAPPGISQPSTSFIAFWRQDIPHALLVA